MCAPISGYSGTPHAKKLARVDGCHVAAMLARDNYMTLLAPLPGNIVVGKRVSRNAHIVPVFSDKKDELKIKLAPLGTTIERDVVVWISWPKKASKLPTDIAEDTIRELALAPGFVDVKVCAVDEIWSGLKLVIRKELRR